jgi:hypothetical protein
MNGFLVAATTVTACGTEAPKIYVHEEGSLVRTDRSHAAVPGLEEITQERLDLHLKRPSRSPSGIVLPLAVALTARADSSGDDLSLFVGSDLPDYQPTYYEFTCDATEKRCEGDSSKNVPVAGEHIRLFPFDRLPFEYDLEFLPPVEWKEVTLYNDTTTFVLGSDVSIELGGKKLILRGTLERFASYKVVFGLLAAGCCVYLWLVMRSMSYLRLHIGLLAAFLAVGFILRQSFLQGAVAFPNLLDVTLIATFVVAVGVVAVRAAHAVQPRHGIFLSYRTVDSACESDWIAKQLVKAFSEKKVFYANDSIEKGEEFPDAIKRAIREADVVLVVIGPNWLGKNGRSEEREIDDPGDWPRREVEVALKSGKRIIPLFVRRATMPEASNLPDSLKTLSLKNGRSLGVPPEFQRHVAEFVAEVRGVLLKD